MDDDREEIDEVQRSVAEHHGYSMYEPHYQQMHPLIFYEDAPSSTHHNHHHIHHQSHPMHFGSTTMSQHHWDTDHCVHVSYMPYGDSSVRSNCIPTTDSIESLIGNHENGVHGNGSGGGSELDGEVQTSEHPPMVSNQTEAGKLQQHQKMIQPDIEATKEGDYITTNHFEGEQEGGNFEGEQDAANVAVVLDNETATETNSNLRCKPITKRQRGRRKRSSGKETNLNGILAEVVGANELVQSQSGSCGVNGEGSDSSSPQPSNRELHNEIERRRRMRIKQCCDVLRTLVPGLNDKTDKATVLELTVKFVNHLTNCADVRCTCSEFG